MCPSPKTLVKVFGELVQHSWPAGSRCSQQLIDTVRVVETTNGLPCQSELPCDSSDSHAFVLESLDRLETILRADGEYRTLLTGGMYLLGDLLQLFRRSAFDRRFSR